MTYWQIASGSQGRKYGKFCLKFGMAFVGYDFRDTMGQVNEGDIVVLKEGKTILAAGRVIQKYGIHWGCGDKEWLRDFDGWDLPAYCYVDWKKPKDPIPNSSLSIATIQGIYHESIIGEANEILDSGSRVKVSQEPSKTELVKDDEILKCLIKAGLRPSSADELTNAISRIRLLADYYYKECGWDNIREHETRTFLVIPLLLALGWAEQQIKIELPSGGRKRIDIACFRKNYEENKDDCVAIIETKGFSSGLNYAREQAKKYSEKFPSCEVLITTNGYCYKIYSKDEDGGFKTDPSAYINLRKPKDKYPIDPNNVKGAIDAIKRLLPNSYYTNSQNQ